MNSHNKKNATRLVAFVILSVAVAGYFTGLQAPMKASPSKSPLLTDAGHRASDMEEGVVPATGYNEMASVTLSQRPTTRLASLKSTADLLAEVEITPQEKDLALQQRDSNRAFNGAPPTIPHPIDQRSDASCVACHRNGIVTKSLNVPRMSHHFLANCTQCHVESNPAHMAATVFRENDFDGLEAPTAGPRAFAGAPPQIPHSTWMRSDCLSCHGLAGRYGIRTTHPWRNNCQQCHTPSATMDQTLLVAEPKFLPGPKVGSGE